MLIFTIHAVIVRKLRRTSVRKQFSDTRYGTVEKVCVETKGLERRMGVNMKKVIIFGAGFYGQSAYYKIKTQVEIICFADNNPALSGAELFGIPIIAGVRLNEVRTPETDVIICAGNYFEIGMQLTKMGITDYYVMLEGFLYHSNAGESMMPVELNRYSYYRKHKHEKNILYVQNTACIRTHKTAALMRNSGYSVFLLYLVAPPAASNAAYSSVYDDIFTFYTQDAVVDFVENSDFDIVHCSNEPDILTNLLLATKKHIVFDTHDMMSIRRTENIEKLVLEYVANTASDGNIYISDWVVDIARKKYDLKNKEIIAWENIVLEQEQITGTSVKLSSLDGELHCVYEGGINGTDRFNHRFFEDIWKKIAECGIHIHFYSQSDYKYCQELDAGNTYFHYEGNLGTKELIQEMTKYDCGLALFNVHEQNRLFLESGSANKIYEYLNAGLPVVVGNIQSHIDFAKKYNIGKKLDMDKDIKAQIADISQISIESNFLTKNRLTMMSRSQELVNFYESVKRRKVIRRRGGRTEVREEMTL